MNRTPRFRFFASVQLAIPLLMLLGCVVAVGTIIESQYSTEYARLLIYDSWWFRVLLIFLWLNIFLSTMSRYPYQKKHLGFVIVHIGLMTLLLGGFVTSVWGIDGSLRVVENSQSSNVSLGDLSLELIDVQSDSAIRVPFARTASRLTGSSLDFINNEFHSKILVRELLPFAEIREGFTEGDASSEGPMAVGFMMKSQFFDVSEWLHSTERPELKMGPATIRLIVDRPDSVARSTKGANKSILLSAASPSKPSKSAPVASARLVIRDEKTGATVRELALKDLKPGMNLTPTTKLTSFKTYQHAVVLENHLSEGDNPGANPAIELNLKSGGKSTREVAYARYPDFSLSKMKGEKNTLGITFSYQLGEDVQAAGAEVEVEAPSAKNKSGNVIEFHVARNSADSLIVELYKNEKQILRQPLAAGESLTTPWMGIKITLGSLKRNASPKTEVIETPIVLRSDLPPSAVYISPAGASADQGFWLGEGQFKRIAILGREYEVYFGHHAIEIPFALKLMEFKKFDYPGTETPMSFESRVKVNGVGPDITISMNEPLKHDGYTIYQSSYDVRPGQPNVSVFSVNRDPGRALKYFGSLILAFGIITFTLMRSRINRRTNKSKGG
jgi:hypothetical protein